MLYWLTLCVAIGTEICWGLSLKWVSVCPYGKWVGLIPLAISIANMSLMSFAVRGLPTGLAFAIWSGLSLVGIIIGGVIFFGDKINFVQGCFMTMIVIGAVGAKFFQSP